MNASLCSILQGIAWQPPGMSDTSAADPWLFPTLLTPYDLSGDQALEFPPSTSKRLEEPTWGLHGGTACPGSECGS